MTTHSDTPRDDAPSVTPKPPARDARWTGFGLFWALFVGTSVVSGLAFALLSELATDIGGIGMSRTLSLLAGLAAMLPWIVVAVAAIWLGIHDRGRMVQGLLFGFLSLLALALLLVAACFGIVMLTGGFGVH